MISETGIVVEVQEEHVLVATRRAHSCGACAARSGCGVALLGKALGQRRSRMRALSGLRLHPGDEVRLQLDPAALLQASLLMYGLPLLALLSGAGLPTALDLPEWAVVAGGFVGLAGGMVGVSYISYRWRCNPRFHPVVTEALPIKGEG